MRKVSTPPAPNATVLRQGQSFMRAAFAISQNGMFSVAYNEKARAHPKLKKRTSSQPFTDYECW